MDPQILAFVLLFAGITLIFAELFLPSGGVIAIMCVLCFAGSIYYAHDAWRESYPLYWWSYVCCVALLIPSSIFGAFYLLTNTSMGNRILLTAPTQEEVTPHQEETQYLESLIGQRGVALNLMTPSGLVEVNGERLHAIGTGLMIEAKTEVEIVEIRGTRVVVKPASELPEETTATFDQTPEDDASPDPWINEEESA